MPIPFTQNIVRRERTAQLVSERRHVAILRAERLLAAWLLVQGGVGIVVSFILGWSSGQGFTPSLFLSVLIGSALAIAPTLVVRREPGARINRVVIASSQITLSTLYIFCVGGQIESHCYIFLSLAILSAYQDMRLVLFATGLAVAEYVLQGLIWDASHFASVSNWQIAEHFFWLSIQNLLIYYRILRTQSENLVIAEYQANLELALKDAEEANKVKSDFLANISHEIRTPMHGILSFARFGQQKTATATSEKLKSYFDEIYDSGSRLMRLLNDLLDLSKLEAGKMNYSIQQNDLMPILRSLKSEMAAFAQERKLSISLHSLSRDLILDCDAERIAQVVRNLLSNAIKFAHENTAIQISVDQNGIRTCVSVVNRGARIPSAELHSIFDKFVQSSRTKTGAGGSGLGLAICQEIIRYHGGTIWAESDAQGRTAFIFEIPHTAVQKNEAAA